MSVFCNIKPGAILSNPVNHPDHYAKVYPFETKDLVRLALNLHGEELSPYEAYCLGNELKYRLRCGFKDPSKIQEDIEKALFYNNERIKSQGKI